MRIFGNTGKLTVKGGEGAPGIGGGRNQKSGNIEINGGIISATTDLWSYSSAIGAGYGGYEGNWQGSKGVGTITINGGTITASGTMGIGSGGGAQCGDITINGGTVTAKGGGDDHIGAGIGGCQGADCSNITINGGNVTAQGGLHAAGIGGAKQQKSGNILITGGTVTASGGINAAGIGTGMEGRCGTITIESTVTKVTAKRGGTSVTYPAPTDIFSIGLGVYNKYYVDNGTPASLCGTITIGDKIYYNRGDAPEPFNPSGDEVALIVDTFVYPQ